MTDMKKCPYCGEDVKLEAIKCRHCQTMLSEENNTPEGAAATVKPQQAAPKVKKPIWKRWWVWVIVGLLVIGMFGGGNGNDEESVDEPEEQVEVVEEPEEEVETEEEPEEVSEVEKFREQIGYNLLYIGEELEWLGGHFNNYDGSEIWYMGTENYIREIRWLIHLAEEIDPPPEKQDHYDFYMESLQYIQESMNLVEEWMETGDDEKLNQTIEYMDIFEEKLDEFQRMMQ